MSLDFNLIEQAYRRLISEGKPVLKVFLGNPAAQGIRFPEDILRKSYAAYAPSVYSSEPKGLQGAREAIAAYYNSKAACDVVDPHNILLTSGTSESFLHLFSLLAHEEGNFLVPCPSYPLFNHIAEMTHVALSPYNLQEEKDWAIDLEEIKNKTDAKTRGIILISPHHPTGKVATADEIRALVAWANAQEIPLICDEVFSEFYFGPGTYPRVMNTAKLDLCFTLNGISKMLALPGLKLSWIAVTGREERVRDAVEKLELSVDTFLTTHFPIQQALPQLLKETNFVAGYHDEIAKRRNLALELLSSSRHLSFARPMGGFFLMARVTKDCGLTEEEFVIRLMEEEGVFVHPGYFYDHEDGIHFVISYSTAPDLLKKGVKKITRFLDGLVERRESKTPPNRL